MNPSEEVRAALTTLNGISFVMGRRDKAFDQAVKTAIGHLEKAKAALGAGPAPQASASIEPSIVEWIYSASANALRAHEMMPPEAVAPTRVEVLAAALLSLREWAAKQLPPERLPQESTDGPEPLQLS